MLAVVRFWHFSEIPKAIVDGWLRFQNGLLSLRNLLTLNAHSGSFQALKCGFLVELVAKGTL